MGLGEVPRRKLWSWVGGVVSRAVALVTVLATMPLLLWMAATGKLIRKRAFCSRQVVRLPAGSDQTLWRTFAMRTFCPQWGDGHTCGCRGWRWAIRHFLPGLLHVVTGKVAIVGVAPRSPQQLQALPADWRMLCVNAKVGLITEAMIFCGSNPNDDDLYSAEASYSVNTGPRHDAKLMFRYWLRFLTGKEA